MILRQSIESVKTNDPLVEENKVKRRLRKQQIKQVLEKEQSFVAERASYVAQIAALKLELENLK